MPAELVSSIGDVMWSVIFILMVTVLSGAWLCLPFFTITTGDFGEHHFLSFWLPWSSVAIFLLLVLCWGLVSSKADFNHLLFRPELIANRKEIFIEARHSILLPAHLVNLPVEIPGSLSCFLVYSNSRQRFHDFGYSIAFLDTVDRITALPILVQGFDQAKYLVEELNSYYQVEPDSRVACGLCQLNPETQKVIESKTIQLETLRNETEPMNGNVELEGVQFNLRHNQGCFELKWQCRYFFPAAWRVFLLFLFFWMFAGASSASWPEGGRGILMLASIIAGLIALLLLYVFLLVVLEECRRVLYSHELIYAEDRFSLYSHFSLFYPWKRKVGEYNTHHETNRFSFQKVLRGATWYQFDSTVYQIQYQSEEDRLEELPLYFHHRSQAAFTTNQLNLFLKTLSNDSK